MPGPSFAGYIVTAFMTTQPAPMAHVIKKHIQILRPARDEREDSESEVRQPQFKRPESRAGHK